MTQTVNPLSIRLTSTLKSHNEKHNSLNRSATTGRKQNLTVIENILGNRCESTASLATSIRTSIATSKNILNLSTSTLKHVKEKFNTLKCDIISLNNADHETLTYAQENVKAKMKEIIQRSWPSVADPIFKNTNFAGKNLFDGTYTEGSEGQNRGPLSVRTGVNINEQIAVAIPKLYLTDEAIAAKAADTADAKTKATADATAAEAATKEATEAAKSAIFTKDFSNNNLKTSTDRASMAKEIDQAIGRLDSLLSTQSAYIDTLESAETNLSEGINLASDSANSYLGSNIDTDIADLNTLNRQTLVTASIYGASDKALNDIINTLIQTMK